MACKKALSERGFDNGFGFFPMRELLKKQNIEKKLATVKNYHQRDRAVRRGPAAFASWERTT